MLTDTWFSRDLPVLTRIAEELEQGAPVKTQPLMDKVGLSRGDLSAALRALDEEYLQIDWPGMFVAGYLPSVYGMTTKARQAVGLWPSAETLVDQFAESVETALSRTDDPDRRSRLVRFRDALTGAGRDVVIDVVGAVISKSISG